MSEIENMLIKELQAIRAEREETNRRYENLTKQLQDLNQSLLEFQKLLSNFLPQSQRS